VVIGRSAETPERTAAEIREETGGAVIAVVADVATLKRQETLLILLVTSRWFGAGMARLPWRMTLDRKRAPS
jgi:hypothetical protein